MFEQLDGPPDDEQAETQAIGLGRIQPLECFEDSGKLICRHADPGVIDIYADVCSTAAAGQQDAA